MTFVFLTSIPGADYLSEYSIRQIFITPEQTLCRVVELESRFDLSLPCRTCRTKLLTTLADNEIKEVPLCNVGVFSVQAGQA